MLLLASTYVALVLLLAPRTQAGDDLRGLCLVLFFQPIFLTQFFQEKWWTVPELTFSVAQLLTILLAGGISAGFFWVFSRFQTEVDKAVREYVAPGWSNCWFGFGLSGVSVSGANFTHHIAWDDIRLAIVEPMYIEFSEATGKRILTLPRRFFSGGDISWMEFQETIEWANNHIAAGAALSWQPYVAAIAADLPQSVRPALPASPPQGVPSDIAKIQLAMRAVGLKICA
jgi:hypothetical protein